MATYEVTSPDGKTWEVNAPDGASQDQVLAYAKQQWAAQVKEPPAAVKAGKGLADIPRQLGLTGRYAAEGTLGVLDMLASPFRVGLNALGANIKPSAQTAGEAMTRIGVPEPQGANERVIGDMSRLVAGAGGMAGGARGLADLTAGTTQRVLSQLAANPGTQGISAAAAGGAGGSVREAGGGPGAQFLASLLGGVGGGLGAGLAQSAGSNLAARTKALLTPQNPQAVEQQIEIALRGTGSEWATLPQNVRAALRSEVEQALKTGGPLNNDAIRRLADFKQVPGVTPTRGMLTQDPALITRERNLAKTGANSSDLGLQRLPRIENQNTQALLDALDSAGARNAPDTFATGQRVIGALQGNIDRSRSTIDRLYSAARDTQGRSAPMDNYAFTSRASQLLDEAMVGGALPKDVQNTLNWIATGQKPVGMHGSVPMPFNVEIAEQFKTQIGKLQRAATDGQARMALGLVRQALDETPLRAAPQVNPGNLPAVPGTVPPSPAALGADSIQAFNRARTANRAFMQRVENTPALRAVMDGAEPDRFVQQFVIGSGATVNDVRQMARAVQQDPQALAAVKANIAAHLKAAATNGTEDVTKWSSAAYNRALNQIGERKLSAFFEPEEIAQLRSIGRVGTLMQSQPAGSAVNNSNSGAMLLGRGLDFLTDRAPLGINALLQGTIRGQQQQSALNVPAALRALPPPQQAGLLERTGVLPALYGTGLLSMPEVVDDGQNRNGR